MRRGIQDEIKQILIRRGWKIDESARENAQGELHEFIHPETGRRRAWLDAVFDEGTREREVRATCKHCKKTAPDGLPGEKIPDWEARTGWRYQGTDISPTCPVCATDAWVCEDSPTGFCVYNSENDPCHDSCLHCGQPEERK